MTPPRLTMFYEDYWFQSSFPIMIVYIIASLFTVSANVFLLVAYTKDPYRELQTAQNYFVVNLGIADLIMGAISEPLLIVTYWNNQNVIYLMHYVFAIISASCSLLNIVALAVVRYFAVRRPLQSQTVVNRKNVQISIGVIWGISLHYAIFPVLGWRDKTFQLYLYSLGCVVPTLVFIFAYCMLYSALRRHNAGISCLGAKESGSIKNALRREKAATKTVCLVLTIFLILWIPFLIIDLLMVQCVDCRTDEFHFARDITLSLVYFSSGINPVIYAWRVESFRRAFLHVAQKQRVFFWRRTEMTECTVTSATLARNTTKHCKPEKGQMNLSVMNLECLTNGCSSNPTYELKPQHSLFCLDFVFFSVFYFKTPAH
ncbi:dopamine D2-like receptor [Acropora millepora]|uniref:dopamine D2-like receptor n=1 Tax=Acropora millepora TaxID=45264 RepID=UPI001CF5DA45|nr:dopamine D2-like receptor [Acropora millepora]